jgi:hypothetical protein
MINIYINVNIVSNNQHYNMLDKLHYKLFNYNYLLSVFTLIITYVNPTKIILIY